jgi:hypothetical protein
LPPASKLRGIGPDNLLSIGTDLIGGLQQHATFLHHQLGERCGLVPIGLLALSPINCKALLRCCNLLEL